MTGSRVAPMWRWLSAALVSGMMGACEPQMEQDPFVSDEVPVEAELSSETGAALARDPYANAVVQSGVIAVLNPSNAVGAPDGNVATFLSLLGGSLLLDMGQGEEGTGPLRIYYRGLSLAVVAQVEFLRPDMTIISTGQANLLDLGVGTHSALVPFSSATPYRYVRLRGGLASVYSVDAVEDTGGGVGAVCGDGRVGSAEQCDDGNRASGDGCNSNCQVEPGYTCQGTQPSVCSDVDECANGTATCQPGQTCVNTPGGYTCQGQTCQAPRVQCGSQCVDVSSDRSNCGGCGVVCPAAKTCSEGVCVMGGIKLQIAATWGRDGDGDLIVRTPTGKLIYYDNRGPDSATDYGLLDMEVTTGRGPERVIWNTGVPPPMGQYDICFKAAGFAPPPSTANPVSYSVTVMRPGEADLVLWGAVVSADVGAECHPAHPAYVTSFTYPGSP